MFCLILKNANYSKGTSIEWRYTDEGQRVRVSQRTGRIIPISKTTEDETEDMVLKSRYIGNNNNKCI